MCWNFTDLFYYLLENGGREEREDPSLSVGESVFWPDIPSDQLLPAHSQISGNGGETPRGFLNRLSAGTHTEELIFITDDAMHSGDAEVWRSGDKNIPADAARLAPSSSFIV